MISIIWKRQNLRISFEIVKPVDDGHIWKYIVKELYKTQKLGEHTKTPI